KQNDAEGEENRQQGASCTADHALQPGKSRCVTDELESPTKSGKAPDVRTEDNREHPRQGSEQIAEPAHRAGPGQPRAPSAAQLGSGRRRCSSQPQDILGNEEGANDPKPDIEPAGPIRPKTVLGIGYHDADSRRHHCMVDSAKSPGGARSLGIEEPIKALAAHRAS